MAVPFRLALVIAGRGWLLALQKGPCPSAVPAFLVLFSDATGSGCLSLQALDQERAAEQARAQYPGARLAALAADVMEGQDRRQLLADWLRDEPLV